MAPAWDIILAGGGLANGLIALRLRQLQPALRVLLLEADSKPGGNHTWSFHEGDITPEQHRWVAPLVAHRWQGYDVRFPDLNRTLAGDYLSITSERFAEVLTATCGDNLHTRVAVTALTPTSVTLADGTTLQARAVIDGRGYMADRHLTTGSQSFLGQQWRLSEPHGLTRPILMDATVNQQGGYRFVYTLPLSATELLIEDTHYVDAARLDAGVARQNIADYAREQCWALAHLEREEQGDLPIMLAGDFPAFWQGRDKQPCSGLRAGLFHATTGYSLPHAVALAEAIAASADSSAAALFSVIHRYSLRQWREQRFFRSLNRMLFLAGDADKRWQVMQRFYSLNEGLIARFYAGNITLADKARILAGKPPVPVGEAMLAILKLTPRMRAFHHE
ncbi:lycopene beta-cyclase CrtY [Leclercia adecarboxylata]|uniref:lycopene beta-cyclase CrtY n=1 Tax=Leclercia TaxID=83654 RepID=UPI000CD28B6E|nr:MULTISPECIES: lycopene beta-cyclase CrtY [Leclercia]POV35219.1 lycopene cyclase [Leclercia sp. LSNIH5]POW67492.1 lycopene cyclase [Leclercia sp. LSNIH2]AUU84707.1 lycopene cyclase [Leclercia sp. LSNIH1]MEB5749160.1 lycopene beta-cyclase CrtY [Leclercia adecarboxylata]QGW16357.1 lycopene beta-cyclase CrtY [Leclercia sp. Colony189]